MNGGTVVAIDVDGASIEYARQRYPGVEFVQLDVLALDRLNGEPFDLAYLFNSFYAFPDQRAALRAIRMACKAGGRLLIYDYTQPAGTELPRALGAEIGAPIVLEHIGAVDDRSRLESGGSRRLVRTVRGGLRRPAAPIRAQPVGDRRDARRRLV
jgi:ubiquinone/menaquinone biosynthesis C-methylase UbiE